MLRDGFCCFSDVPNVRRAIWLITRSCNRECPYCFARSIPGQVTEPQVRSDIFEDVIPKLCSLGYSDILLTGGEPFLLTDFFQFARSFNDSGFAIAISTNGDYLDDAAYRKLLDLNIRSINLSLDSAEQFQNDTGRGKAAFRNTLRALRLSLRGPWRTRLTAVIDKWNRDDLKSMIRLLGREGVRFLAVTAAFPRVLRVSDRKGVEFLRDLATTEYDMELSFQRIIYGEDICGGLGCIGFKEKYLFLDPRADMLPCIVQEPDESIPYVPILSLSAEELDHSFRVFEERYPIAPCMKNRHIIQNPE